MGKDVVKPDLVLPGIEADDALELARLGDEVRGWEQKARSSLTQAVESQFAIGRRLSRARAILRDNPSYGRWFKAQQFGFTTQWGNTLSRAADREIPVRELMGAQAEPNIKAALEVITKAERQAARGSFETQVSNERIVLPSTIKVSCRDARDHFPDEIADLAIFSPPYPDGSIVYDNDTDAISLDAWTDLIGTAAAVLVDGWQVSRVCMVVPSAVGRSPYVPLTGIAWDALKAAGFAPEGEIVWDKATTGNRTTWGSFRLPTEPRLRDRHEVVLVGRSPHSQRIPDGTFTDDGTGRSVSPWLDSMSFTDLTQSVWQVSPASAKAVGHPAPFPPGLVERLLRLYGWPGCTVLDPFAGAGTVGEVAVKLGANAILSDQSQRYCDLMEQRIGMRVA